MGSRTNLCSNIVYLMSQEPLSDNVNTILDIYIQGILNFDDANFMHEGVDQIRCIELLGKILIEFYPHKDIADEDYFRAQFVKAYKLYRSQGGYPIDEDYANDACPWFDFEIKAPKNVVTTLAHTFAERAWLRDKEMQKYMNSVVTCSCGHEAKRMEITIVNEDGERKELCADCYAERKSTNG